jgi:hypothetical protein
MLPPCSGAISRALTAASRPARPHTLVDTDRTLMPASWAAGRLSAVDRTDRPKRLLQQPAEEDHHHRDDDQHHQLGALDRDREEADPPATVDQHRVPDVLGLLLGDGEPELQEQDQLGDAQRGHEQQEPWLGEQAPQDQLGRDAEDDAAQHGERERQAVGDVVADVEQRPSRSRRRRRSGPGRS